jgi:hypothetical protein
MLFDTTTTLTRMFNKLKSLKTVDVLSCNVWAYLAQLIPWNTIREDWLTFDSTVLLRYGKQEGANTSSTCGIVPATWPPGPTSLPSLPIPTGVSGAVSGFWGLLLTAGFT